MAYSRGAFYKAFAVLDRYVSVCLPRQAISTEPLTFTDFQDSLCSERYLGIGQYETKLDWTQFITINKPCDY